MELYKRRVHSAIDKLPKELIATITHMITNDYWPDNYIGEKVGKPKYIDIVEYVKQQGYKISEYTIGRYSRRLVAFSVMKQSAEFVKLAMKSAKNEKISETQKALAEMLTASIINTLASKEDLSAKELCMLSSANRDCFKVAISADKYIREQIQENIKKADRRIEAVGKKDQINPETLKAIREQIYGILEWNPGTSNTKN